MTTHDESGGLQDEAMNASTLPLAILITRLADGDASDEDWDEFQRRAAADHTPWKQLAEEQYVANQLRLGFERVAIRADRVELPATSPVSATAVVASSTPTLHNNETRHDPTPMSILAYAAHLSRTYGGWAAAAALAIVWTISVALPQNNQARHQIADNGVETGRNTPNALSVNDSMTPDQYYDKYLQSPFVVKELQPLLLQTSTNADGQPVVTYMRRIIEKRSINGIYRRASDGYNDGVLIPGSISGLQNNDTVY